MRAAGRGGGDTVGDIFSIVPIEVWADKRLTLKQMRVLGVLFSFRNKNTDIVWPSRIQIAERCGMSVCHISTATTDLERLGWLRKDGKGGHSKSTRYAITVPDFVDVKTVPESGTAADSETVPDSGTVLDCGTVPESGTGGVPESGTRLRVPESGTGKEQTSEQTRVVDVAPVSRKTADALRGEKPPSTKGTRLPADWQLPKAWGEWALAEVPRWSADQVRKVGETFGDYWRAKAGKDAVKADWMATWRNWVRREAERNSSAIPRPPTPSTPDPFRGCI